MDNRNNVYLGIILVSDCHTYSLTPLTHTRKACSHALPRAHNHHVLTLFCLPPKLFHLSPSFLLLSVFSYLPSSTRPPISFSHHPSIQRRSCPKVLPNPLISSCFFLYNGTYKVANNSLLTIISEPPVVNTKSNAAGFSLSILVSCILKAHNLLLQGRRRNVDRTYDE